MSIQVVVADDQALVRAGFRLPGRFGLGPGGRG